jgi:hypothetical protein
MLIRNFLIFGGISKFSGRDRGNQQIIRVSANSRKLKIFVAFAIFFSSAWVPADQRLCLKSVYNSQQETTLKIQAVPFPTVF